LSAKLPEIPYPEWLAQGVGHITGLMRGYYGLSRQSIALLVLMGDENIAALVRKQEGPNRWNLISAAAEKMQRFSSEPLNYIVAVSRQKAAGTLMENVVYTAKSRPETWLDILGRLTMQPPVGIPVLVLVMYLALYRFVGVFGAGILVDYIEGIIFESYLNPWFNAVVEQLIPWPLIQDLLVHDYGIITLGLRYAVAIIFPIVGCFFLMFSLIEDSGYLPRMALLVDRLFKCLGLSGRAVIPLTLGLGCATMGTLVTRTLETTRERVIATLLLALAVPCSAQLGVILSLLSGQRTALVIWAGFILLVFITVGSLMAQVLPGEGPVFYLEVPPLRVPQLGNVLTKTFTRMQWYFYEVVPLFVLASVVIWLGTSTGFFYHAVSGLGRLAIYLGLPVETGAVFLFGFFRRDYGAAGLYDLVAQGLLSTRQLVVTAVTLTLFVPCVAQFAVMVKERGLAVALGMAVFVVLLAFTAGWALNVILTLLGLA
jgi:ferrous iron transport protein B